MHVTLFRALRSANIAEDAAEKVVHAFEEHIDMAVAEAMKHHDDRITAMQTVLETRLDTGFKNIEASIKGFEGRFTGFECRLTGMQTSIDVLTWAIIVQGTLLAIVGTVTGVLRLIH